MVFKTTRRMLTEAKTLQAIQNAENQAHEATQLLDNLVRALGTCKMNQVLSITELTRLLRVAENSETGTALLRAPHDQDPRVREARRRALLHLGRTI